MRTRRNVVLGVAAAALAATACGMAVSSSAGIPRVHVDRVAARNVPMSVSVTTMKDLAGVKRQVQRPSAEMSVFRLQRDLAAVKRGTGVNAAQQPRGR